MSEAVAQMAAIEARLEAVTSALPEPWSASLETRGATGGESFIATGTAQDEDREFYATIVIGAEALRSPDPRIDAFLDFVASTISDIPFLIAEVRRLQGGEGAAR